MTRIRLLIAAAFLGLALTIGGAFVYANQTTAAQKDCRAQQTAILRMTGQPEPPQAYQFCLHDPNRSPAAFWQN
jgi:hypothetical protein